ncbi:hypothetical protein CONLIGDRAFT_715509 [Coniochaeta ligniaria NRRL 30616]|uniref:mRNA stability protein n=1 Tax=Coniochaeta ligniaria NRRL 30616 TaxID=1408157 RepID=A0A1J7IP19_9PEZI|nr:hypothetical protein CONLIGDRAFT_715509 [Coniochaeta ligniaria NRRL 30616]
MNPHKDNKMKEAVDADSLRAKTKYGHLPKNFLPRHRVIDRKYFDSGDFALQKAGKADNLDTGIVGTEHPVPEKIPHLSSPVGAAANGGASVGGLGNPLLAPHHMHQAHQAGSPVKESSFLHRETSADDVVQQQQGPGDGKQGSENAQAAGIPIRR